MSVALLVSANECRPRASESGFAVARRSDPRPGSRRWRRPCRVRSGRAEVSVPEDVEEVLFVLEGRGRLSDRTAEAHQLEPESGAYIAPGETYAIENDGPSVLRAVAVRVPGWAGPVPGSAGARAVCPPARGTGRRGGDDATRVPDRGRPGTRAALGDPLRRLHPHRPRTRSLPHLRRGDLRARRRGRIPRGRRARRRLSEGSCIQLPARDRSLP